MPMDNVLAIKQWLNDKHVIVPDQWVEACVQFLNEEFRNQNLPLQRLKSAVYEQWLTADLEEICISTLPHEISLIPKTSLNGFYTLQVNGIRDVGRPAYAQLRQLEGKTNADVEVSAAPKAALPEWEAKPTRMLILNLTDGVSCLQGMEYRPIRTLSPNLSPGVKVLIKGPVECRLGMLLLTADKIDILGGEVEKHQQKYSREGVLKDALQISSNGTVDTVGGSESDATIATDLSVVRNSISSRHYTEDMANVRGQSSRNPFNAPVSRVQSSRPTAYQVQDNNNDDAFADNLDYSDFEDVGRTHTRHIEMTSNDVDSENEDEEMLREAYEFQAQSHPISAEQSFLENKAHVESTSDVKDSPSVLLTCLNNIPDCSSDFTITIKGHISKVLSRLECKAIGGWHLTAKVTDSTSSIDVDFDNKVVERFIGMSAKEMMALQIQARENADARNKVANALKNCKKKLQELNCLMEIQFCSGKSPCVVKCF